MKPVQDWDEDYILHELPVGEFDWLDLKGRRGLDLTIPNVQESTALDNLSKQIAAFANSGASRYRTLP